MPQEKLSFRWQSAVRFKGNKMILNAFFLAFRQIRRNFLRAILTMLGVIIGVGAVIIMITLGNGTTQVITERMSSLGSNILLVFPARDQTPGKGRKKAIYATRC